MIGILVAALVKLAVLVTVQSSPPPPVLSIPRGEFPVDVRPVPPSSNP
jgi:hypothetical protein